MDAKRRRLVPARAAARAAAASAAAILSAAALAGCGSARRRVPAPPAPPPAPFAPLAAGLLRTAPTRAPARRAAHPTWLVNPDQPLPRRSPWWPALATARRFAMADMSYEVGELGPAVRRAIAGTCTRALDAQLIDHPAILPPGVRANQVRQRLVAVTPLDRLAHAALVLATVRSTAGEKAPGAVELRLVPRAQGWRVAGLRVV